MRILKIIPFLFFLAASLSFSGKAGWCAEPGEGFSLLASPFAEARYKKNFAGGGKTADPDVFRFRAGTEGLQVSAYGKKKDGGSPEMTSLRAWLAPFADNRVMLQGFYGSVSHNGFASRIRNPPGKTAATVYYPVTPTKSLFFGQGTASDKTALAADVLLGNWRLAFFADSTDLGGESGAAWAAGGWIGNIPFLKTGRLSLLAFGGRNVLPEKTDSSWFPGTHRENASANLYAGAEASLKTKRFSSSLLFSRADAVLGADGNHFRADAVLYAKHGRLAFFYSKTDRHYPALSGGEFSVLEKRGASPYLTWTFRKKGWLRLAGGAIFYEAVEKGERGTDADATLRYAGGFLSAATLTSSVTARIKKDGTRIQLEGSAKSAALFSRRLVLEGYAKSVLTDRGSEPETTKITGGVTFRATLHRSFGISGERTGEKDGETEYTLSALFTERISVWRTKTDLSCKFSAHTDDRKFSGTVTVRSTLE